MARGAAQHPCQVSWSIKSEDKQMRPQIFFYETFVEEQQALQHYLGAEITAEFVEGTIQETRHIEPPAPLISTRTQSIIPISWHSRLTGVLTRSTGYEHLHSFLHTAELRSAKNIACGYLPDYCSRAVAEQTGLLWLALLRKLPLQLKQLPTFQRNHLTGRECYQKTLLVVGVGNIGYAVAQLGIGLGMRVLGVDIDPRHEDVDYVPLAIGLRQADVVVSAMNLTSANRGYFNYPTLKQAPKGTVFINVARGELSPIADLLRLLKEQHLGGVALDVYEDEKQLAVALRYGEIGKEVDELRALGSFENVLLTPHNAFNTQEALARKAEHSVLQIKHFLERGKFLWSVPGANGE